MNVFLNPTIAKIFPKKALYELEQRTTQGIKSGNYIDVDSFVKNLTEISDIYAYKNKQEIFNEKAFSFAERVAQLSRIDISSAIFKLLLKINEKNLSFIEKITKKRLEIAEKNNDFAGILSGNRILAKIYSKTDKCGNQEHMDVLLKVRKSIENIICNYDVASEKFNINPWKLQTLDNYEFQLGSILMEIAKLELKDSPSLALVNLNRAYDTISKYGEGTMTYRINGLKKRAQYYLKQLKNNNNQ